VTGRKIVWEELGLDVEPFATQFFGELDRSGDNALHERKEERLSFSRRLRFVVGASTRWGLLDGEP
jgi:hypothetical protein